ncbi:hypothetical protein EMIT0324P_220012 [Pseudomonas chlororaphis]|uniref:EAL domain-containing protein n=1 Tax=Pseudomonas chlororaphis TaxID=587753 RepID=UPI0039E5A16E
MKHKAPLALRFWLMMRGLPQLIYSLIAPPTCNFVPLLLHRRSLWRETGRTACSLSKMHTGTHAPPLPAIAGKTLTHQTPHSPQDATTNFIKNSNARYFSARIIFSIASLWIYKNIISIHYNYISSEVADFLKALNRNELAVRYQPIVDMRSGLWLGAEALLRWPKKGERFNPETIVTRLERAGLMQSVTRWVCRQVIEDYSQLIWACDDLYYITINLSAADVMDPTFPDFIERLLAQYNVASSRIAFEITERVALEEDRAVLQLKRLHAQGHLIVLDDFGTGYSNLSYLDNLPIDIIKIDKSFTIKNDGATANIIVTHILHMAKKLGINVVVEGVETLQQVERLSALGADVAQGWFYSKELSADALARGYFSVPHPKIHQAI